MGHLVNGLLGSCFVWLFGYLIIGLLGLFGYWDIGLLVCWGIGLVGYLVIGVFVGLLDDSFIWLLMSRLFGYLIIGLCTGWIMRLFESLGYSFGYWVIWSSGYLVSRLLVIWLMGHLVSWLLVYWVSWLIGYRFVG